VKLSHAQTRALRLLAKKSKATASILQCSINTLQALERKGLVAMSDPNHRDWWCYLRYTRFYDITEKGKSEVA